MKAKVLTQFFTDTPLTVLGLVLFFVAFLALVGWVYFRKGAKAEYEQIARMPLSSDGERA